MYAMMSQTLLPCRLVHAAGHQVSYVESQAVVAHSNHKAQPLRTETLVRWIYRLPRLRPPRLTRCRDVLLLSLD